MVKRISIFMVVLAAACVGATSAQASGPITISSVTVQTRHVAVAWTGPYLKFGVVQIATRPDTGTDGNFFSENRVQYDTFDEGTTNWLDSDPIKPGTYWLRVDGWDDQCKYYDYGYGITGWDGCDTYSNIVQFTVKPNCKKTVARRGYYTSRNGHRIWHKPLYKTVCS